jgi:hypothetical protein
MCAKSTEIRGLHSRNKPISAIIRPATPFISSIVLLRPTPVSIELVARSPDRDKRTHVRIDSPGAQAARCATTRIASAMAEKAAAVGKYKDDARDNRLKLNTNLEEVRARRGRMRRRVAAR